MARTLAIPVAVLLAGAVCAATLLAMSMVTVPHLRVVVGEEPAAAPEPTAEPAPESSGEPTEEDPGQPGGSGKDEPDTDPQPSPAEEPQEPRSPPAAAEPDSVPPSAYNGSSTSVGTFRVVVEVAYTDATITNGTGSYAEAPAGWEYHIYRINVTNEGSSPVIFDSSGTVGTTTDGESFDNDVDAEHTVAYDYFWGEIDPGTTVTTHIMFLAPVGTQFAHVLVAGQSDLRPG